MSHRGPKDTRSSANIRLIWDPSVTACFQIQEQGEFDKWVTLRMFSNEHEARNLFARIKEHGLDLQVLDTAKVARS
jgi:hypothetical protein